jgi:hypothetical protein
VCLSNLETPFDASPEALNIRKNTPKFVLSEGMSKSLGKSLVKSLRKLLSFGKRGSVNTN